MARVEQTDGALAYAEPAPLFRLEPMTQTDVPEVNKVERRCFSQPWPISAYRRELRNTQQNHYIVLRALPDPQRTQLPPERVTISRIDSLRQIARIPLAYLPRRDHVAPAGPHIAGFAGMWVLYDEAHVTTIGVDPLYRGRGFGELLLIALFEEAIRRGATWITLEVRVSNTLAQRLYSKYGMTIQATRKGYYSDNGEDAYVMWSRSLRDAEYREQIEQLRLALKERLGPDVTVPEAAPSWHDDRTNA